MEEMPLGRVHSEKLWRLLNSAVEIKVLQRKLGLGRLFKPWNFVTEESWKNPNETIIA